MKARFIDEQTILPLTKKVLKYNGKLYLNPETNPELNLFEMGYKEVIEADKPWYDPNVEDLESYYFETNEKIIICYKVKKLKEN